MFTSKELKAIHVLANNKLKDDKLTDTQREGLQLISNKTDDNHLDNDMSVSQKRINYILELFDMADGLINIYTNNSADTSQMYLYDELKKKSLALMNNLADLASDMKATAEIYDDKTKQIREGISLEYMEAEKCSVAMADKKARTDDRYKRAMEDFGEFSRWTARVRAKYFVLEAMNKSVVQSISMARINIGKEGGQQ